MIRKTLGGDRLGTGKKMTVDMKTYQRSTHDLSYVWRSTMASGTLVPFMSQIALPGDTWDIELECDVKTHPTLGPLFGSYKVQLDVFCTPIRLYNSWLHNNKLGIGLTMEDVLLPQIQLYTTANEAIIENDQVSTSALLRYLGISGLGVMGTGQIAGEPMTREFNAVPLLTYWDIFKNYFANKQETNAYVIHTSQNIFPVEIDSVTGGIATILGHNAPDGGGTVAIMTNTTIQFTFDHNVTNDGPEAANLDNIIIQTDHGRFPVTTLFPILTTQPSADQIAMIQNGSGIYVGYQLEWWTTYSTESGIFLEAFPLANIDSMREQILANAGNEPFIIGTGSLEPYNLPMQPLLDVNGDTVYSIKYSQEGLAVKTYNSDLLNNWIQTEIQTYITNTTAISTLSGSFTIDQINLAQKVYNMLNRIAVSGGTYDDWIETVWTNETLRKAETPMYMGGLIKELAFQELISTATTDTDNGGAQPLGQLAGKGTLTRKHKGGTIQIKTKEPSYITGIISLTPRIDYSQGNQWDVNLKTLNDFHKPELDEIGFQDLITEPMAWYGTANNSDGTITTHSAGKQPAWINYMTNINKTYGNFADINNEMFMTLNRRYEADQTIQNIKDITTYIDPTKFNFIFAETDLTSQNFWTQIGINATVRRKMSAKIIPNL